MLIDMNTGKEVSKKIPHMDTFTPFTKKISTEDYKKIVDWLNNKIDTDIENGTSIQTAGWMPGNKWEGTVFEAISNACNGNKELSSMVFGIIVWEVFKARDDTWGFGRYNLRDMPIESMTYFRLDKKVNATVSATVFP
jgi:hypothetical protein